MTRSTKIRIFVIFVTLNVVISLYVGFFAFFRPQEYQRIKLSYDGQGLNITDFEANKSVNKSWSIIQPSPVLTVDNASSKSCDMVLHGEKTNEQHSVPAGKGKTVFANREILQLRFCDSEISLDVR